VAGRAGVYFNWAKKSKKSRKVTKKTAKKVPNKHINSAVLQAAAKLSLTGIGGCGLRV